jgi:hypothetical protein
MPKVSDEEKDAITQALGEPETAKDLTPVATSGTLAGFELTSPSALSENINVLIYGESGAGKTVLAGSSSVTSDMSPVLLIDVEGGTMSLTDFYPDVQVIRVTQWRDLQKVYDAIRKGEGGYKTVIIDSLTEVQKFSMQQIMKDVIKDDPTRDPDVPGIREWGKNIEQTRRFVRGFRDLPINVIFTSLADASKDDNGRRTLRPMMSGKLQNELPGLVDLVFYLYIKPQGDERKRLLLTTSTDKVMAKDRSNKLPAVLESPDMNTIYSTITN